MSENDLQTITTVENPTNNNGRFPTNSSDDSSQSSLPPPMTGLVQPQQPHWPQHSTAQNHHLHSTSYLLDADDDQDDLDYDDYSGSGPGTPGGPSSPASSYGRSKRSNSNKRTIQPGKAKSECTIDLIENRSID